MGEFARGRLGPDIVNRASPLDSAKFVLVPSFAFALLARVRRCAPLGKEKRNEGQSVRRWEEFGRKGVIRSVPVTAAVHLVAFWGPRLKIVQKYKLAECPAGADER